MLDMRESVVLLMYGFLLYEAFSPSRCTVFPKIVRGSLLNEFEQTLYDSIIEIFCNVFLLLNTCALHFKLDYCKGVRQFIP